MHTLASRQRETDRERERERKRKGIKANAVSEKIRGE
jgi:hypothetical protein